MSRAARPNNIGAARDLDRHLTLPFPANGFAQKPA
jgi:hypothetical protein